MGRGRYLFGLGQATGVTLTLRSLTSFGLVTGMECGTAVDTSLTCGKSLLGHKKTTISVTVNISRPIYLEVCS